MSLAEALYARWVFVAWCSHCDDLEVVPPGTFIEIHTHSPNEEAILVSMEISHALKGCNGRLSWGDKP